MSNTHSADIIAFPQRVRPIEAAPNDDPCERLTAALAALDDALARQKNAVAAWRDAMGTLQSSVAGLGTSLHLYRDALGTLGSRVDGLHAEATALEARAGQALQGD